MKGAERLMDMVPGTAGALDTAPPAGTGTGTWVKDLGKGMATGIV